MSKLMIQYVMRHEMEGLNSEQKIHKILDIVKEDKLVLMEGKLKQAEEAELIAFTMQSISKKFKGIEIAVIDPSQTTDSSFLTRLKSKVATSVLGITSGLTVVGPASIVREIKQDPQKIQLFTLNIGRGK